MRIRYLVVVAAVLAVATGLVLALPLTRASHGNTTATTALAAAVTDPGTASGKRSTAPETPTAAQHSIASQPTAAQLDAAQCGADPGGKWIRVSISRQRAWLCDGASLILATPVTTGADVPDRRTLAGTWHIQGKETDRWLGGPGYSVQVNWWMPYDGDFGLHDADWQTMPFGSPQWRTDGSHGCVHLPHAAMAELYAWAPVGTTITIET